MKENTTSGKYSIRSNIRAAQIARGSWIIVRLVIRKPGPNETALFLSLIP